MSLQYNIKNWIVGFCICTAFLPVCNLSAQVKNDSIAVSSLGIKSPTGAVIRSTLVPGWGQMYNGKWLKALIVVGTEAGLAGNAMLMNSRMLNSNTPDEREFYQYHRGTFVWWFVGIYLLNILDAYVDAQLFEFDVSPDLGIQSMISGMTVRGTIQISFNSFGQF